PCGMAIPLPTPVEPSFSRCIRISKILRSLWPDSSAALAASSCKACFLPLTFSAGMIALGATRSLSGMECFQNPGTQARARLTKRRRTIRADSRVVNGSKARNRDHHEYRHSLFMLTNRARVNFLPTACTCRGYLSWGLRRFVDLGVVRKELPRPAGQIITRMGAGVSPGGPCDAACIDAA